jgi:hypothetical protein
MSGTIPPLPQYAFIAWCSVKAKGQLYLYLYILEERHVLCTRADATIDTGVKL